MITTNDASINDVGQDYNFLGFNGYKTIFFTFLAYMLVYHPLR